MYILGKVINLIVLALIAIGDFVLLFFRSPFNVFGKERPARSKKTRSGTFKLPKKNRKSYSVNLLKLLFRIARGGKNLFSKILIKKRIKAQRKRNRAAVLKQGNILRPSFGYKLKYVFIGSVFSFVFLFIPLLSYFFVSDLPSPGNLSVNYIPKTTKIYDRKGALLYEVFANQNRTVVRLSDVPKDLRDATIAIEDKDFYAHPGFDLRGITRAFITNIRKEGFQGGSTITQQLVKSAFLTPDPTITRKIKEVVLAFWAERIYTKDQILELYLNYVPYGGTAWGVESASDVYFGKKVSNLTLAESAFLAGLPRAPSVYSPFFGNGDQWRRRQKEVLDAMVRLSYINQNEAKSAYEEELIFRNPKVPIKAPHFVMYVRKILIDKFGLNEVERGGLNVTTSLDLVAQDEAERIVQEE